MISVKQKFYFLSIYSRTINIVDYIRLANYTSYIGRKPAFFFEKKGHTSYVDLTKSEEELFSLMKSNYRNEVRKAINLGVVSDVELDISGFVSYYNEFAVKRGIEKISIKNITKYNSFVITKAILNTTVLSYHAYILDSESKIVRLLYSASNRLDDAVDSKLIGYSNKYLHYDDFKRFKTMGFKIYDFAGVCEDQNDKEKYGIGLFKKGFGGTIVTTHSYYSPLMKLSLKLKFLLNKYYNNKFR